MESDTKRAAPSAAQPIGIVMDSPRSGPVDYLEIKAGVMLRLRIRTGLQCVKGYGIDWWEQCGCLGSVFTVCGHPTVIALIKRALAGVAATKPPRSRGHHLDTVV
jgi:hypothetical protein